MRLLGVRGRSNNRGTNRKRAKACRGIEKMLGKKMRGWKCLKWTEGTEGGSGQGARSKAWSQGSAHTQKSRSPAARQEVFMAEGTKQEVTKVVFLA